MSSGAESFFWGGGAQFWVSYPASSAFLTRSLGSGTLTLHGSLFKIQHSRECSLRDELLWWDEVLCLKRKMEITKTGRCKKGGGLCVANSVKKNYVRFCTEILVLALCFTFSLFLFVSCFRVLSVALRVDLECPVVTICTTNLTFNNSTFCPHSVFMCFVFIWEQTVIISLYSINWLVFITEI